MKPLLIIIPLGCVWALLAIHSHEASFCRNDEGYTILLFLYGYSFTGFASGVILFARRKLIVGWRILWILPWAFLLAVPSVFLIHEWAVQTWRETELTVRQSHASLIVQRGPFFAREDILSPSTKYGSCLPQGVPYESLAPKEDAENMPPVPSKQTMLEWETKCKPQYALSFFRPVTIYVRGSPTQFNRFILWSHWKCQNAPANFAVFLNDTVVVAMARQYSYSRTDVFGRYVCQFPVETRKSVAALFPLESELKCQH
ncbi:MAG: hypothetical protein K1X75_13095 [Leptospirales bacterium]|nr:hypothetical protein [Leptospirales bacterium]